MRFLKLIYKALEDFFILVFPFNFDKDKYRFGFLIHPRDLDDVYRQYSFFRFFPNIIIKIVTRFYWPITISEIKGLKSIKNGKDIKGYIFAIPLTAHQIFENRQLAVKKILRAANLARKRGVKLIGLGGLTSSVTKGGIDVVENVNINVTTGHAYTAYNVTKYLFEFVEKFGLNLDAIRVSIVGATGSVGSTSAKILAKAGVNSLVLVDLERKREKFHTLIKELESLNPKIKIVVTHKNKNIKGSEFVIAATNAPEALIRSQDISSGTVIIDDAQPSDVHEELYSRDDVIVLEAGVVYTPGITNNYNFELKGKNDNFCCLAEVLILAATEHKKHYTINRADLDKVEEVKNMGRDLGFKTAVPQNFREVISKKRIERVSKILNNKKN